MYSFPFAFTVLILAQYGLCFDDMATIRICGKNMVTLMSFICEGRYATPEGKRSEMAPMFWKIKAHPESLKCKQLEMVEEFNNQNLLAREQSAKLQLADEQDDAPFEGFDRLRRGGITSECCRQPCTRKQLRRYCE